MSSTSIPVPKKLSDDRFIGDLIGLLGRRKVAIGDATCLESFGSELASNDALRSDLFTLCTAISHMAESDLTGEQLLMLVARAVGGVGAPTDQHRIDIPEDLRSTFITGYDAWINRGAEIEDEWPPPRQVGASDNFPAPSEVMKEFGEPIAPKVAERGRRTLQEALEIAKKQAPFELPPNRPTQSGVNVEGLTLGELKNVLEEIERRLKRIDPLHHSNSAIRPLASESWGRLSERAAPEATVPEIGPGAEATGDDQSDDPFLKRHRYLRPPKRNVVDTPPVPFVPSDLSDDSVVPELPTVAVPPLLTSEVIPIDVPERVSILTTPLVPSSTPIKLAPYGLTGLDPTPAPSNGAVPRPKAIAGDETSQASYTRAFSLRVGSLRISSPSVDVRMVVGFAAALILIAGGYTGVSLYHYLHPRYVYAGLTLPTPAPVAETLAPPPVAPAPIVAPVVQARLKPGPKPGAASSSRPVSHTSPAVHFSLRTPPVSVWPPSNQGVALRDAQGAGLALSASATTPMRPAAASATASPHRTPAISDAIYVPSSRIMEYALVAPPPIYPQNPTGGAEATVVLQVTISRLGTVMDTKTISGPLEMRPAAIAAVRMWRFKPYLLDGLPTDVVTTLELPAKAQ